MQKRTGRIERTLKVTDCEKNLEQYNWNQNKNPLKIFWFRYMLSTLFNCISVFSYQDQMDIIWNGGEKMTFPHSIGWRAGCFL